MLRFEVLHPLAKLLFLMSFMACFFVNDAISVSYLLVAFVLLLVSARFNPLKYKLLWIYLGALCLLGTATYRGEYDMVFLAYLYCLVIKWTIVIITGYVYARHMSPPEMIYLVRRGIRSKRAALPLVVGLKTLPHAVDTYDRIRLAQAARGIGPNKRQLKPLALFISTLISAFLAYFFQFLFDLHMILAMRMGSTNAVAVYRRYGVHIFEGLILVYLVSLLFVLWFS